MDLCSLEGIYHRTDDSAQRKMAGGGGGRGLKGRSEKKVGPVSIMLSTISFRLRNPDLSMPHSALSSPARQLRMPWPFRDCEEWTDVISWLLFLISPFAWSLAKVKEDARLRLELRTRFVRSRRGDELGVLSGRMGINCRDPTGNR
ncbi:hypothetical protein ACO22_03623 [Paracoccidioides brasiliensis]|uniref:Uncharacterized protein n=1 Tax=Paracoccidioides brasiliensis TaxID=121759 RepID=A0A1D2JFE0_PARBR|nr:hypothetical protein ACO22_03623 [Paracoccidioides brasiliensis]